MIDLDDLERVANRWPDNSYVAFSAAAWKAPTGEPLVVVAATELRALVAAARGQEWISDMSAAPKDREIWVYAPEYDGLPAIQCRCQWHEDAGFCVDELRFVTHWRPLPPPPAEEPSR